MSFSKIVFVFFAALTFGLSANASSGSALTYEGILTNTDGTAVVDTATQFKFQVRSPGAENCLMYEEIQTLDLSATAGYFKISLNDGTGTRTDTNSYSIDQTFANYSTFTFASGVCAAGTTYTPNYADGRVLQILTKTSTDGSFETFPTQNIGFIPMALQAKQVGGFAATNLLRVENGSGPQTATSFSPQNFTDLISLINGTSTMYMQSGTAAGSALPVVAGSPSSPTAGSIWYDTTANKVEYYNGTSTQTVGTGAGGSGTMTSVTAGAGLTGGTITTAGTIALSASGVTAGSYPKVTVDTFGRVTSGGPLSASDLPASGVTAGSYKTITVDVAGRVTTGSNPTTLSGFGITDAVQNVAGVPSMSAGLDASLPTAGTTGRIYFATDTHKIYRDNGTSWDVLSSGTGSAGTVTSVATGTGLSGGPFTSTGTISLANTSVMAASYGSATQVPTFTVNAQGQLTAAGNITIAGTIPGGSAGGDLTGSYPNPTLGKISGTSLTITSLASGNYLRYNGTIWQNSALLSTDVTAALGFAPINAGQMPANCSSNQTLTFSSPTGTWACSSISVAGSAFGSQSMATFLAAPIAASGAPAFRTIAPTDLPLTGTSGIYGNGGNSFGAPAFLGTNDSYPLTLRSSGLAVLTLTPTGNAGIGTTSPTAALNIKAGTAALAPLQLTAGTNLTTPLSGAIEYDGTSLYYTDSTATRRTIASTSGSGSESFGQDVTMSGSGTGLAVTNAATIGTTLGVTGLTTLTGGLTSAGTAAVTNSTASTSSTTGALTVSGGAGISGALFTGGNITSIGDFFAASGTSSAPSHSFTNDPATGAWLPATGMYAISSSGVERMRVLSNGNVGIGTTSPAAALDVNGHIANSTTALTPSGITCSSTTASIAGNDTRGIITVGSGATTCSFSFTTTYSIAPVCVASWGSSALAQVIAAHATTSALTITFSGTTSTTSTVNYICIQ
jgi:hypothetical protein